MPFLASIMLIMFMLCALFIGVVEWANKRLTELNLCSINRFTNKNQRYSNNRMSMEMNCDDDQSNRLNQSSALTTIDIILF